jgi:hypothetical protein
MQPIAKEISNAFWRMKLQKSYYNVVTKIKLYPKRNPPLVATAPKGKDEMEHIVAPKGNASETSLKILLIH